MVNRKKQKQITVFLGCLIRDDKVLIIQRTEEECVEAHIKWDLPGGKVNFGETAQEAVRREFLEETGVEVYVKELLPHVQLNYWNYPTKIQQTLVLCFRCEFIKENRPPKDHHVKRVTWVNIRRLKELSSLPGIEEFVTLAYRDGINNDRSRTIFPLERI